MRPDESMAARLLLADDQPDVLAALRLLLKGEGYLVETVSSPAAVLKSMAEQDYDSVIIDLNYARDTTSGQEGLDLLARIQATDPNQSVVVMTAWSSVELAVEAMRRGARDFIQKPWDNARLLAIVRTQAELSRALRQSQRLEAENRLLKPSSTRLIAASRAMQQVLDVIERVGPSEANIFITGENGTGKGVVAQALHAASSRAGKSLITVNTGGLSENLFESELFGHVKGAFTDAKSDRVGRFELADGGTLFLDEIANVPLAQQNKLLRVLETGEFERVGSSRSHRVNARVISATNANLDQEIAAGRFRQDLLFRLNTIEIHLPPLRERKEDIAPLAMHFLQLHAQRYRKRIEDFEAAAMQALWTYAWPGNIRELNHAVERAVLMAAGNTIKAADLSLHGSRPATPSLDEMSLEEVECFLIRKALARHNGNVSKAAEVLGLSRGAFYRRMEKYHI
jgi:DNA-binding NtrC family response regulator